MFIFYFQIGGLEERDLKERGYIVHSIMHKRFAEFMKQSHAHLLFGWAVSSELQEHGNQKSQLLEHSGNS